MSPRLWTCKEADLKSHPRLRGGLAALLITLALGLFASTALAASVTNGGFETGDFTGWTKATTCIFDSSATADWFVYSGTASPSTSRSIDAPPEGTYAATTDQVGPATEILYQDIALEAASTHSLSFQVYYNSEAPLVTPNSLACQDPAVGQNQQYRIDVMNPAAPLDSVAAGDVLATIFQTQDSDPQVLAPTLITFDLTPFAGQTVRLRFAQAVNINFFRAAVDDVQIESTPINQAPTCNDLPATVYVQDGVIVGGPQNGKPYKGELTGTSGNDVMVGTNGKDKINGRPGNDTICALDGGDRLEGEAGNDTMYGGAGGDRFKGGAGIDSAPDFNPSEGDSQEQVEQLP
jgi:hypothetical protein